MMFFARLIYALLYVLVLIIRTINKLVPIISNANVILSTYKVKLYLEMDEIERTLNKKVN